MRSAWASEDGRWMSRICVTGGLGFIGSHLSRALWELGHEVTCIDRLSGRYAPGCGLDAEGALGELPGVSVVPVDIADEPLEPLFEDAAAVVHLAALPGVRAGHHPAELFRHNTLATARVLAALRPEQRLLFVSTSSVYGDAAPIPTPESWPACPLNPYAASKLSAEHACLAAAAAGQDVVIARLFTVYGPRQRPDMAFARWIEGIRTGRPILLCARADACRDFTYVDDAVRGLTAALAGGRAGRAYNVPGVGAVPVGRALATIEEILGRSADVVSRPSPTHESRTTAACPRRAARELDYSARVTLAEGLRRQVASVLEPGPSLAPVGV